MSILARSPVVVSHPAWSRPDGEQLLLLHDVSWDDYVALGRIFQDRPAIRLTYDDGDLEIMTTSSEHEAYKLFGTCVIQVLAEEFGFALAMLGQMTFEREDLTKGFEGDNCFWIAHERQMRGKLTYDPYVDPPPDLFLEIEVSRRAIPRMKLFAALGIPEVWCFDGRSVRVHVLQGGEYRVVERSPTFPLVPLQELVRFMQPSQDKDSAALMRELRAWLRTLKRKPRRRTR